MWRPPAQLCTSRSSAQTLTGVLLLLPLQISLALNLTVAGPMTVPFSTSDQSDVITPWTQFFGNHLQSVTINNSQEDLANNSVSGEPLCMGPGGCCLGLAPLQTISTHFLAATRHLVQQ